MDSSERDGFCSFFCDLCGAYLSFTSATYATCLLCDAHCSVAGLEGLEIWCNVPEEALIKLALNPLLPPETGKPSDDYDDPRHWRPLVNEECPKCQNPQLEYYTRQLRSADEGQTVFYECRKCEHKFSVQM